ncbi:hypothetical protein F5883DRAFT_581702 [Diaporthe sp. PMI_573]|nr:hypothetical protein F5883DRAFT_581702 [Diaporthaceae sp. PMI_573]
MDGIETTSDPQNQEAYRIIQQIRRQLKEQSRRLWQNRPQSWRYLLSLLCGIHFAILFGRLSSDLAFFGLRLTPLIMLGAAAVLIAIATRIVWHALFKNPYAFLGYRRPGTPYRRTVPALILHVAMIRASAKALRPLMVDLMVDFIQSIMALVLLLTAIALYIWMLQRFLLRHNNDYEPTAPLPVPEENTTPSVRQLAPRPSPSGHLSRAYARQRSHIHRRGEEGQGRCSQVADAAASRGATASGTASPSQSTTPVPSASSQPPRPLKCRTIARFDYLPHSRLSDRLIILVMAVYGILITYLLCMLIQENSLSKLPSPKAKGGLYAPLGVFLLCAVAAKRMRRSSLFAKAHIAAPNPWVRIETMFGGPVFRNSEDGSTTAVDPRLRVFPIKHRDYIAEYNDTRSACEQYWGHLGREWVTSFRSRPTLLRFVILGIAFWLFAKGFLCIFTYPVYKGEDAKQPHLTPSDLQRLLRIMYLQVKLMAATIPLALIVLFYTGFSSLKLFSLWTDAIIKYAPAVRPGLGRQTHI